MSDNSSKVNLKQIIIVILIVALASLYFSLSYNRVFYASDEGATAYHFEKSMEGAIQHRDFYSVYGMAYYIMGKWLFQLFGAKLIVIHLFTVVLKLIIAVLIYFVTLRLTRPSFAFLSSMGFAIWWADPFVTAPMFLYPAHIGQLLGLLGVLFLFIYIGNGRKIFVLFAGLTVGLSGVFKPNLALFHLLCFFLFFYARELLLDQTAGSEKPGEPERSSPVLLAKIGISVELVLVIGAVSLMLKMFARYGFDMGIFMFFLFPICLVVGFLLSGALKVLRSREAHPALWKNFKDTFAAYWILAGGFIFWQLVQIAYFARHGALGDFFHMLGTAASYYSRYAIPEMWKALTTMLVCAAVIATVALFRQIIARTAGFSARRKIMVATIPMLLALAAPVSWVVQRNIPSRDHFLVLSVPSLVSILVVLFLAFRKSRRNIEKDQVPETLCLTLIGFYSATNMLDAIPKIDLGHWFMVLPPLLILFGVVAERFYDMWRDYLASAAPRASRIVPRAIIGLLALQVFVPSMSMMLMFHVTIIQSAKIGYYLYKGKLALVPRHRIDVERARGIVIHTIRGEYRPPLVDPASLDFFEIAGRVSDMTRKDDRIFATMTSGLMLFFLADRDSVSDIANCYVWQTCMGTTTSKDIKDFSDRDLLQILKTNMPKAIVVEEGPKKDYETKRFIENWPITWSFIQANYRVAESAGAYHIYVPAR
jgi:hypothetical protein